MQDEQTTNTALPIVRTDSVKMIAQSAPLAYQNNSNSCAKCNEVGQCLLDTVQGEGMSDALDQEIASYLEKTKRTLRKMNESRSPVTKLFDQIRSEFTVLENTIDPTKKGTIPYQLQAIRNAFAAKKREEAERKRREEQARIEAENAKRKYAEDVEDDFKQQLNAAIVNQINTLTALNADITLASFNVVESKIRAVSHKLPDDWFQHVSSSVRLPVGVPVEESSAIRSRVLLSLIPGFKEQFDIEVGDTKADILDRLPSKLRMLKDAAKASAEEAARLKEQMRLKEEEEARQREEARAKKEAEEKAAKELAAQKQEMGDLFGAAALDTAQYQPKTSVKKRIVPLTPEAFMPIVGMWWAKEGCTLSVEELSKLFKKQITFCEKLANDKEHPEFITDQHVLYEDEVKAK